MSSRLKLEIIHISIPIHFDLATRSTPLLDFVLVSNTTLISYTDQVQCPSISDHAPDYIDYRDFCNIDWDGMFLLLNDFYIAIKVYSKCSFLTSLLNNLFPNVPIVKKYMYYIDTWMESRNVADRILFFLHYNITSRI